jgi:O-acetylhomoserine/O-acetylserine sulfhydrylase-like pyridoxal-dependent enzyme
MSTDPRPLATQCAHCGVSRRGSGVANEPFQRPIVQSTIFDLGTSENAEAIFCGTRKGYAYSRFGNPSVEGLAEMSAGMEGGAGALGRSSPVRATPPYCAP